MSPRKLREKDHISAYENSHRSFRYCKLRGNTRRVKILSVERDGERKVAEHHLNTKSLQTRQLFSKPAKAFSDRVGDFGAG